MTANNPRRKLTLDERANYRITVSGHLAEEWAEQFDAAALASTECGGSTISTINGSFDQAALHGVLRRLYSLGFPLISVSWVDGRRYWSGS